MKIILSLLMLLSASLFAQQSEDPCSVYKNQRKCESSEAVSKKCKWHKSKEICKNEDIQKKDSEEARKGFDATSDEEDAPVSKSKKK